MNGLLKFITCGSVDDGKSTLIGHILYDAKLLYADTLQYHPTGAAFPAQIFGALVTEKVRSMGAKLINVDGEVITADGIYENGEIYMGADFWAILGYTLSGNGAELISE